MREYDRIIIAKDKYSMDELMETLNHPVMSHCVFKPYRKQVSPWRAAFAKNWWLYADESGFRDEIMEKYGSFRDDFFRN